jgi:pyruvate ferredoxin oxidoreductase gamma subunit
MIEVLWNGRGGQGAFTAAKILGAAWVLKSDSSFALAFPSFGPERRGAPVRAFNKLGDKPINNRSEIKESDFIVYLDDTLFSDTALSWLKADGKIILNTIKRYDDPRIITINADKIANDIINRPITNTAMLGALSAVCSDIAIPEIEKAIAAALPQRQVAGNIAVVKAAKEAVG